MVNQAPLGKVLLMDDERVRKFVIDVRVFAAAHPHHKIIDPVGEVWTAVVVGLHHQRTVRNAPV